MKHSRIFAWFIAASMLVMTGCHHPKSTGPGEPSMAVVVESAKSPRQELVDTIDKTFADPRFFNAHWGVLIESLDTGEVWYEHNADKLFLPASNEKIPTTAAALLYLGPDFVYETPVCYRGEISGDTLNGDLVIFGNGDPTIYNRFHNDARDVFRGWARDLKARGITRITGDIIGDDNAWDDEHTGNGWPLDELTPWYYAEYGALTFNENYVDIRIVPPATADGEVELIPNVPSSYYTLINKIEVATEGGNSVWMYRPMDSNEITMGGRVVAGTKAFEETPTITNPTLWYVWVVKEVLEEEGIAVDGKPVDCDDIDGWNHKAEDFTAFFTQKSPPLSEIIKGLMKRSQNMYAETMPHTMGWKATGTGTFNAGREVVRDELAKLGIDRNGYNYSDGSGLSRYNYISPRIIVTIYREMLKSSYAPYWWEAQAIAGESPGTLRSRMKGTPAEGNMRGKTGMIYAVRSLSGYVKTADGEQLAFSFLCNGHQRTSGEVDAIYDSVAVILAGYSEKQEPMQEPAQ